MIMPAALSSSSPTAVDMFTTSTLIRVSYGPSRKRASQTLHDHSSSASETQPCGGVFIHSFGALGQFWKAEVGSVSQAPKPPADAIGNTCFTDVSICPITLDAQLRSVPGIRTSASVTGNGTFSTKSVI